MTEPLDLPGTDWAGGDLDAVLEYVREATLNGVRGIYDQGGTAYRPVASLFYADRVRMVPYESKSLAAYMEDLRRQARERRAIAVAVVVGSDLGVLVSLEHRDLARDVLWWADLRAPRPGDKVVTVVDGVATGPGFLGEWEQRPGPPAGTGSWSVLRGQRGGVS